MSPAQRAAMVLLFFVTVGAGDALACSCIRTDDPVGAAAQQDAVFRGRVLATVVVLADESGRLAYEGEPQRSGTLQQFTVVRVDEIFKGDVPPVITLVAGPGSGDCGYPFKKDGEYVVYAEKTKDKIVTAVAGASPAWTSSLCFFTTPVAEAGELRTALVKKYSSRKPVRLLEEK